MLIQHFYYETIQGLIRVQDFLKEAERNEWIIRLYRFGPDRPYRDVFWEIKQTKIDNVLLDVRRENIFHALKHVSVYKQRQVKKKRKRLVHVVVVAHVGWLNAHVPIGYSENGQIRNKMGV